MTVLDLLLICKVFFFYFMSWCLRTQNKSICPTNKTDMRSPEISGN